MVEEAVSRASWLVWSDGAGRRAEQLTQRGITHCGSKDLEVGHEGVIIIVERQHVPCLTLEVVDSFRLNLLGPAFL